MKIWKKSSARTVVPHTIHLTKNESCYRYNCSSGEFSRNSNYYWIFDSFLKEEITICVTTDILIEYEEIISKHMGRKIATTVLNLLENAPNIELITKYFKWNLIHIDPDDNKFVDCAVASSAKYLVSNDKHFKILKKIAFPKVETLTANEFKLALGKEI